ncbi:hypothetical protein CMO94_01495 [Candidatus Woesearchaeota archaeon]|jgi:radical SAM protein with 4Fe4S-binding SPASM domain|nr:hypothetical protein [Candidatus Woesearchaeota archaeon]|tara:strand:- start:4357 stop:6915 length:2559 start_codon:yes stop_codon:yes gene_type:complete
MEKMELPNEIVIEVTRKCNLSCDFCFNKQGENISGELDKKTIFNILEKISEQGIKAVRFSGGEPFLRKDLGELLRKAKSLGLYVILNTNGLLIKEKEFDYFNDIDLVLFSFHETDKYSTIKKLLKSLEDYNTQIMFGTIMNKDNISNLKTFYELISKIEEKKEFQWALLRHVPNENNNDPISKKDIQELYKGVMEYNEKFGMDIKIVNSMPFCAIKEDLASICKGGDFDSGNTRLVIDCTGNYKTDYRSTKQLGNIHNKSILEVWNSQEVKDIRKFKKIKDECKECYHLEKCKGGLQYYETLTEPSNIKPIVSVIIPTYNNKEDLNLALKSLFTQRCRKSVFEIIVVDDGSSDGTSDEVANWQKNYANIKYCHQSDKGFRAGQARNLGAKYASGKVLIFLDDDSVVPENFITSHMKVLKNADVVLGYNASYGSKKEYNKEEIISKLNGKNKINELHIIPEFRHNIFIDPLQNNSIKNEKIWKVFGAGANVSIRKTLFDKFKFDNDFVGWGEEDIELGYRLAKNNHKIIFCNSIISYNIGQKKEIHPFLSKERFISSIKNQLLMYKKHPYDEIREYIEERYENSPEELKNDINLDFKSVISDNNTNNTKTNRKTLFFRDDDVGELTPNLIRLLSIFIEENIPVNLEVIPSKITKKSLSYLLKIKNNYPRLVEFHQHGFNHNNYNDGFIGEEYEFGNKRLYDEQYSDIIHGKILMEKHFNGGFFQAFCPPYYGYNDDTLKILDSLGYKAFLDYDFLENNFGKTNVSFKRIPANIEFLGQNQDGVFLRDTGKIDKEIEEKIRNENQIGIVIHHEFMNEKYFKYLHRTIKDLKQNNKIEFKLFSEMIKSENIIPCN